MRGKFDALEAASHVPKGEKKRQVIFLMTCEKYVDEALFGPKREAGKQVLNAASGRSRSATPAGEVPEHDVANEVEGRLKYTNVGGKLDACRASRTKIKAPNKSIVSALCSEDANAARSIAEKILQTEKMRTCKWLAPTPRSRKKSDLTISRSM